MMVMRLFSWMCPAVSLPLPVRFSQAMRFGPSTLRLSMPLGDRLIRPSASAVDTKKIGCCSMNAVCLSENFVNCLAIGLRSETIAFYALKEVAIAYWVKFGEFCFEKWTSVLQWVDLFRKA